jgi:hypothetical protein
MIWRKCVSSPAPSAALLLLLATCEGVNVNAVDVAHVIGAPAGLVVRVTAGSRAPGS